MCGGDGVSIFDGRVYDAARWRQGQTAMLEEVARFHAAHPDSFGPSAAQLLCAELVKGGVGFRGAILESLIQAKVMVREGAQIRRSSHSIELSLSEKALWRTIAPLLGPDRRPMTVHDIASQQQLELKVVQRILQRATRAGQVVRIASGRFLHKSAFLDLAAKGADARRKLRRWLVRRDRVSRSIQPRPWRLDRALGALRSDRFHATGRRSAARAQGGRAYPRCESLLRGARPPGTLDALQIVGL